MTSTQTLSRDLSLVIRQLLRTDRALTLRGAVTAAVMGACVPLIGLASRSLVNVLAAAPRQATWLGPAIWLVATIAVLMLATWLNFGAVSLLSIRMSRDIDMMMLDAERDRVSVNHLQGGQVQQLAAVLEDQRDLVAALPAVVNATVTLVASTAALLGLALVTSVALFPLFAGLAALAGASMLAQRRLTAVVRRTAVTTRVTRSLFALLTAVSPAQDVRTGGAAEILTEDYSAEWEAQDIALHGARRSGVLFGAVGELILVGTFSLSLILTLSSGSLDAGTAALALILAIQAAAIGGTIYPVLSNLGQCLGVYRQFAELVDAHLTAPPTSAPPIRTPEARGVPAQPGAAAAAITDVVVRYLPDEPPALRGVSLNVPVGTLVAIVGENGSGKSTLASVLLGLRQPDEGDVRLSPAPAVSAVFQDFAQVESTVGEGVRFGAADATDQQVTDTVAGVGGGPWLERLPAGLDTDVGSSSRPGLDLSRGQWQRIALARGTISERPVLVVLDEATSALDAQTEQRLVDTQLNAARCLARAGETAVVLITHRLPSARLADVIHVMSEGRIVETGTHDELMTADGLYAQMFRLQASGYR